MRLELLIIFTVSIVFWGLNNTAYGKNFDKDGLNQCFRIQSQKYLNGQLSLFTETGISEISFNSTNETSTTFAHEISYASGEGSLGAHYLIKEYKLSNSSAITIVAFSPNQGFRIEETLYILDNNRKVISKTSTTYFYDDECLLVKKDKIESIVTEAPFYVFLGDFPLTNPLKVNIQSVPIKIDNLDSEVIFNPIKSDKLQSDKMTYSGYRATIKGQPFKSEYFEAESGRKVSLFYLGGVINRKIETISKFQWLSENFNESIKVTNINDSEIRSSNLRLRLLGTGDAPNILNKEKYFETLHTTNQSGTWQMNIEYKIESLPYSVSWNTPPTADELQYLEDTPSIHKQAVSEIANRLKKQLKNVSRIEAAYYLNKEILKVLKYNPNTTTNATTEDILKKGDGICFHYSILFSSIARALNIPTKSIGGLVPRSDGMMPHAWNEIKIDKENWYPIEPQSKDIRPFQRGYIPTEDFSNVSDPFKSGTRPEYLLEPTTPKNPYGLADITKF